MHHLFHTTGEKSEITKITKEVETVAWESLEMEEVFRLGFSNDIGLQVFLLIGVPVQIQVLV